MSTDTTGQQQPEPNEVTKHDLPATLDNQQLAEIAENVLGRMATAVIHNFDGGPHDKWRRQAVASSNECRKFDDLDAGLMQVKYFYAHPVEIEGVGGELRDATRVVFFDADDNAVAFVSQGVAKGLGQLINAFGWGPWEPAIQCRVVKSPTRNGHIYNILPA